MKNKGQAGLIILVIVIVLAIGLFFYFNYYSTQPDLSDLNQTNQTKTFSVAINDNSFSPSTLTINKGDTVTWVNNQNSTQTVTSDTGSELNSGSIQPGYTYSHTFNSARIYYYHSDLNTNMTGTVTVQ